MWLLSFVSFHDSWLVKGCKAGPDLRAGDDKHRQNAAKRV